MALLASHLDSSVASGQRDGAAGLVDSSAGLADSPMNSVAYVVCLCFISFWSLLLVDKNLDFSDRSPDFAVARLHPFSPRFFEL